MTVIQLISDAFLLLGSFFIFTSAIGAVRMPDFYTRVHALGIGDVCGVPLFLIGLIFKIGINYNSGKILLLVILIIMTSPTATHIISRTAYRKGVKPIGIIEDTQLENKIKEKIDEN